jgi:hypothetical protein
MLVCTFLLWQLPENILAIHFPSTLPYIAIALFLIETANLFLLVQKYFDHLITVTKKVAITLAI